MKQYNTYEALFLLESFITQRNNKLSDAFVEQVETGRSDWHYPADAREDNQETEKALLNHFSEGLLAMPLEGHEVHFKRCEDSGVAYCTCMSNKRVVETIEPI